MRKILLIFFLLVTIFSYSQVREMPKLSTITAMKSYTGGADYIFVTDDATGGQFFLYTGADPADEIIIYAGQAGRKWKRVATSGSAGLDSIVFSNSGNLGERLAWTSVNGDTAFLKKLVSGTGITIINQTDSSILIIQDSTGVDYFWKTGGNLTTTAKILGTKSSQDIILTTNNTERGRLWAQGVLSIGGTPNSNIHSGFYTEDTIYAGDLNFNLTPSTLTGISPTANGYAFKLANSVITNFGNTSGYWSTDRAIGTTSGRWDFQFNNIKPTPGSTSTALLTNYRGGFNYNAGADTAVIPARITGSRMVVFYEDSLSWSTGVYRHVPPLYRAIETYIGDSRFNIIMGQSGFGVPNTTATLPFGVTIWKSLGLHKDSITLQTTDGPRHMLVIDTATGNVQRMAIPSGGGGESYTFQHSITESGGTVNLVNDEASPGNDKLYGTNGSGVKGWYDQPAGGGSSYTFSTGLTESTGTVTNNLSTGVSGGQTLNLATGSGEGGTIQSTTHATKGDVIIVGNLVPGSANAYYLGIAAARWQGMSINSVNFNVGGTPVNNTMGYGPGFSISNTQTPSPSGVNILNFSSAGSTATSGITNLFNISTAQFAPTSGTGVYNVLQIANTINQTGGANGITRGIFITPTLTSAADYRAFENTLGNVIIGSTSGNVGVGITAPTASLHLRAGTTALTPLKFTSGTNLTTPEAGSVEYDGTNWYFNPSTTRKRLPLSDNATPSNGQLLIGNGTDYTVASLTSTNGTITITPGTGTLNIATTVVVSEGSYTPTLTNGANVAASTPTVVRWTRIGNQVHVWGQLQIDPTVADNACFITMSLPGGALETDFIVPGDNGLVAGTMGIVPSVADETDRGIVQAADGDNVVLICTPSGNGNSTWKFHFSFLIVGAS